jgi:ABC-type transport system involved in multi-copper enzyme maturation permease subunit
LLAGPIFSREALTLPRQFRHFLIRSGYLAALAILMYTAGQATFGFQEVTNVGDLARFGALAFQLLSIVQLSLVLFFALLFAAGRIAQEKDRKTLVLLLMTDLRNRELALGKLFSSLLIVGVLLAASAPVLAVVYLLGGVSLMQIGGVLVLSAVAALAAGSWGALVAFSREKTFQTLAISVLGLVVGLGLCEAVVTLTGPDSTVGSFVALFNPYRALVAVLDPFAASAEGRLASSVLALLGLAVVFNGLAVWKLRIWNPPRVIHQTAREEDAAERKSRARAIWSNPVIWREIRTRAYGKKTAFIKVAYLALAGVVFVSLPGAGESGRLVLGMIGPAGAMFLGLCLLSLMLINAQAVTSITSERDGQTLELLLVTDITAKEFIYGKLGGVLYNTKELIAVPLLLAAYFAAQGTLTLEHAVYVVVGFLVLVAFAEVLGLHSGLGFESSRAAIANSLGTIFFLFIGIFVFMMLLVEARTSYILQFQSFLVFIVAGGFALWYSLTYKIPSTALTVSGFLLPFLTFFAITEFLLNGSLGVCFAVSIAYGFTTVAMLIPAVSEFDLALGRTTFESQ